MLQRSVRNIVSRSLWQHGRGAGMASEAFLNHHVKDGGFLSPWESFLNRTPGEIGRKMAERRTSLPHTTPPKVVPLDWRAIESPKSSLQATWLGHASFLVQQEGFTYLTDPAFSDRCSPFQFIGPRRLFPPLCDVGELPVVDFVLISHNHYDHLDTGTIRKLWNKSEEELAKGVRKAPIQFILPLHAGKSLSSAVSSIPTDCIHDGDWWESVVVEEVEGGGVEVKGGGEEVVVGREGGKLCPVVPRSRYSHPSPTSTQHSSSSSSSSSSTSSLRVVVLPAQHNSHRWLWDRNQTLWGSFGVVGEKSRYFFAGDTGYRNAETICPVFAEIGERVGPFDLASIPIGAYDPRFVMEPIHADPDDAADIHIDIRSKQSIGMHWGTWRLTYEPTLEPPKKLKKGIEARNLPQESFQAPPPGTTVLANTER